MRKSFPIFLGITFGLLLVGINANELTLEKERQTEFYGDFDYLFWFANQDGLSYATSAASTNCSNNVFLNGTDQFLEPGWNSGGRFLVGFRPASIPLDTNFIYAFYFASANNSVDAASSSVPPSGAACFSEGSLILSDATISLFEQFPGTMNFSVAGNWSLFFNRLDWEVGRGIPIGIDFTFRPFFGVEGIGINQTLNETVTTIYQSLQNGLPVTDTIQVQNKGDFWGVGSKAGFNGIFHLGKGFRFFGSAAGSILWGHFDINQSYNQIDYYVDGTTTDIGSERINHSHNSSILNSDLAIGLDWRCYFSESRRTLGLKVAWEEHFYTDVNRFQDFYIQDIASGSAVYAFDRNFQKGNLILSGFTFGLLLNY